MKHFFTILFILTSMNVFAQNWAPFPLDETSEWRTSMVRGPGDFSGEYYNELSHKITDTVVFDGKEFFEFEYQGWHWSTASPNHGGFPMEHTSGISGLIRAEDGVYYSYRNGEETVIVDFSAEVGDTIPNTNLRIDSIGFVNVNGKVCKKLWLSLYSNNSYWAIEGVGHANGGFFDPWYEWYENNTLCYRENDVPIIVSVSSGLHPCTIANLDEEPSKNDISLSPNPSTGIFNLDLQHQFSYQVFDMFGKLVDEGNGSGQSVIDITSQPNGIYLLKVDSGQGWFTQKLIKQ